VRRRTRSGLIGVVVAVVFLVHVFTFAVERVKRIADRRRLRLVASDLIGENAFRLTYVPA
jgi:hypothetical protein